MGSLGWVLFLDGFAVGSLEKLPFVDGFAVGNLRWFAGTFAFTGENLGRLPCGQSLTSGNLGWLPGDRSADSRGPREVAEVSLGGPSGALRGSWRPGPGFRSRGLVDTSAPVAVKR